MRGFSRSLGAFRNRQIRKSIRHDMRYYHSNSAGCLLPILIIILTIIIIIGVLA